jgi:lipid A 3-O-deacylase
LVWSRNGVVFLMFKWFGVRFCAALVCAFLGVSCAHADDIIHEIKFGVLLHDAPHLLSGFRRETASADINVEAQLKPSYFFLGGTIRPALGGTVSTDGQTSHMYADARWTFVQPGGMFFSVGIGAAIHDGMWSNRDPHSKALGSMALFHVPVEIGYQIDAVNSVSIYFEHISNGSFQIYNEGLDRLGVRYGYKY